MTEARSRNLISLAIFAAAAAALFVFHANRFVATNDEGMILEPAQRMLSGARPYVDFFGYMTPGSYWMQALVFRIFGVAMWTARMPVILDFSAQCALVFWIAARASSRRVGAVAALIFAGFQIADPSYLTSAHRWDSATLALAAVAAALSEFRWKYAVSGVLIGAAAWSTPALAAVGLAIGIFLAMRTRRDLMPFAAGMAAATVPAIAALAWTASFTAFVRQLLWLRTNYSAVNIMPYGSIIGGYRTLFEGSANAAEVAVRAFLVTGVALPAILPVAGLIIMAIGWPRASAEDRRVLELLALTTIAVTATVFPRADVAHLTFIEALPLVVCAVGFARVLPARAGAALGMAAMLLATIFGSNFFTTLRSTERVESSIGTLRVPSKQAGGMGRLLAEVRPGASLFVYPYMPVLYFATQANNPTRFSFLAPGMMTEREAAAALEQLRAHPPEWVLSMKLSREEFLRVFPHAQDLDWRFASLEEWIQANYAPVEPGVSVWGYRLYRCAACSTESVTYGAGRIR